MLRSSFIWTFFAPRVIPLQAWDKNNPTYTYTVFNIFTFVSVGSSIYEILSSLNTRRLVPNQVEQATTAVWVPHA